MQLQKYQTTSFQFKNKPVIKTLAVQKGSKMDDLIKYANRSFSAQTDSTGKRLKPFSDIFFQKQFLSKIFNFLKK
jgi:hypothetical protein